MLYSLPKSGCPPVKLSHFPTRLQAFIFRAYEYIPVERIASVLKTDAENVKKAAKDMGLPETSPGDIWLKRGYITIIRRMWHILPYDQLLELLDMDEASLAVIMKEDDFLGIKLGDKPVCERIVWRELTCAEKKETEKLKQITEAISIGGKDPFDFEYEVPDIDFSGKERIVSRIIYPFSGLYQHAFDIDSKEFLPDAQLEAYKKLGINGIWTQGVLSMLTPFPFAPKLSKGYESRIKRMKEMTERLDRYGIKLYLYLNEPRQMPLDFFKAHKNIKGHERKDFACLCTSSPEVQNYLKDSVEFICRSAPLIGGFFTITRSENPTNCYSHSGSRGVPCNCPRCKELSVGEVIGKTVACLLEGAHRVDPTIKVFAWSWSWNEHSEDIIRHLPKETVLLSQSELDVPFNIGGVEGRVLDYSMSINGPGERAKKEWALAKELGLETGAKVQINTTWEASTVPALPVSPSIDRHIRELAECGVRHLLLSWTLGGYPCRNIVAAAKYFYEKFTLCGSSEKLVSAERQFEKAFREFPFHIGVLYNGPQNAGPSNMLFEEPTGYHSTMTCFAYDDLDGWKSIYPTDVFESQFEKLCREWKLGLDLLPKGSESEGVLMAHAAYCLFRSSLNQIRFIRARDKDLPSLAVKAAKDELGITQKMLELMKKNASIGYEAANHYYFSKGQLLEKIINCNYMIDFFSKKK